VWSKTGQHYKGDYDFGLSKDSPSGSYSLEIRCSGADCEKAAIQSFLTTLPEQATRQMLRDPEA